MLESTSCLTRQDQVELLELLEAKRRVRAKSNLIEYAKYIDIPGAPVNEDEDCEEFYPDNVTPAKHHELLLNTLEMVVSGEIKRLMIFMPPGSAKSTYASVVFPTNYMGRFPRKNIIKATYGSDLAKKFGRKCRSICKSKKFKELYGCELTAGNTAADDWSLTNGSTYMCGGILSGVTGNRADGLIIDDPIKGREEADSETIRAKTWEAYKSDLRTRLKPKGWQIIIQTRWHEDDLSGRILPEDYNGETGWIVSQGGEKWYVLCLQAQAERKDDPLGRKVGEWLWTSWFDEEFWENEKRVQGARNWAALYQQRPAPEGGDFFKEEWLRYYETTPEHLQIYGASDYAVTSKGGDYTVHGVMGVDPHDNLYVLDWWRGQEDSLTWAQVFCDMVLQWKPLQWGDEGGVIDKSMAPLLHKMQVEQKAWCARESYPARADKATRAQAIRGRMAAGKVYFPKNAPWLSDLIDELMIFDNGKHDDQVDVLGLFGRMLYHMQAAKQPPAARTAQIEVRNPTLGEMTAEHDRTFEQQQKKNRFY